MGEHPRPFLGIYLNDHRAGAAGGLSLARRCLANNRGTPLAETLDQLVAEIAEDEQTLEPVLDKLAIRRDPVRVAIALAVERLGRLKPNGRLRGYTPLG